MDAKEVGKSPSLSFGVQEMGAACDRAIEQIEEKEYDSWVPEDGYTEALDYGIAFFRKRCKIKLKRHKF